MSKKYNVILRQHNYGYALSSMSPKSLEGKGSDDRPFVTLSRDLMDLYFAHGNALYFKNIKQIMYCYLVARSHVTTRPFTQKGFIIREVKINV